MKCSGVAKFFVLSNKALDELLINQWDLNMDKPPQRIGKVGRRPQILMRSVMHLPFFDQLRQTLH